MTRQFRVPISSRYANTPIFQDEDEQGSPTNTFFYGTWEFVEMPDSPDDTFFTVDLAHIGRLDVIANKVYGDPRLWWVIANKNLITDQRSLKTGTILRVPARTTVQRLLLNG